MGKLKNSWSLCGLLWALGFGLSCCGSNGSNGTAPEDDATQNDATADVGADVSQADADAGSVDLSLDAAVDTVTENDVAETEVCNEVNSDWTVGLLVCLPDAYNGYTFFAPIRSTTTYLIDIHGRLVHEWDSDHQPGNSAYLLENGNLLRTGNVSAGFGDAFRGGGIGGLVEEQTWDGTVVWEYEYANAQHWQHHDIERLPNGNTLLIAWESVSSADAIAEGRNPTQLSEGALWPDHIVEVQPDGLTGGIIVWEWHAWDHLIQDFDPAVNNYGVVEDHPELIDVNYPPNPSADWLHINAVAYNEAFDQIVLSSHNTNEIWVIDHSTTTEEAAGHTGGDSGMGGDILYRWGNPQAHGAGTGADQWTYGQHDSHWIADGSPGEGNIMVFNNGMNRPDGEYSNIIEIVPPVNELGVYTLTGGAYGPDEPIWMYEADPPEELFSGAISGAGRLPNGNTLICSGNDGNFYEVTPAGDIVWHYINPVGQGGRVTQGDPPPTQGRNPTNNVFRAYRYAPDYPGLSGRDLTPGDTIEWPAD